MKDRSDWWSISNEKSYGPDVKPSNQEIDAKNFTIVGIQLGSGLKILTKKLGKAKAVVRGDASTGRWQHCYESAEPSKKMYLIFEFGEDDSTFYLFTDGKDWEGSNLCVKSKKISANLTTVSGLRLGLSPEQVKAVLGSPEFATGDRLVYSRQFNKKSSPSQFECQRKEYPDKLSDQQAHDKFDFYPVETYVEARFRKSKLSYLAVSKSSE